LQHAVLQSVLRRNGVHPYAAGMPRRAPLALSLMLLTLAGCGGQAASGGGDPASAVPADAAAYIELTVRPEGSQRSDALAAAGKVLATSDPEGKIEQLLQQAFSKSNGLKLDYARDVKPWLGSKAGFWLAPVRTGEQTRGAAVLDATDADAARSALDRAVKGSGQRFTTRSYKGVDYQVNDEGGAAAVADDYVVLGSEAELKRTLEVLDGGKPLGGEDRYRKAIAPLDRDRLGTAYVNLKALFAAAAAQNPAAAAQFQQLNRIVPLDSLGGAAAQFTADGDRLAADAVFAGGKAYQQRFGMFATGGSTPLIQDLPGGSWFALGAPKFGDSVRNAYRQFVGEADRGGARQGQGRDRLWRVGRGRRARAVAAARGRAGVLRGEGGARRRLRAGVRARHAAGGLAHRVRGEGPGGVRQGQALSGCVLGGRRGRQARRRRRPLAGRRRAQVVAATSTSASIRISALSVFAM
jgi:hypothetical protein